MGNLFAECQRCSIAQCDLCNEVLPRVGHGQQGAEDGLGFPGSSGPSGNAGRGTPWSQGLASNYQPANMTEAELITLAQQRSWLEAGHLAGAMPRDESSGSGQMQRLIDDADLARMQAIYSPGLLSALRGAAPAPPRHQSEDELMAQALQAQEHEEDTRNRSMLRDEQAREYEESLRIDRQRKEEKLQKQQEEEQKQKEAEEAEVQKRKEEEKAKDKEKEEEDAKRARIISSVEDARSRLSDEPSAEDPGRVVVRIRTPEGKALKRAFRGTDAISQVYDYAVAEGGETLASQQFRLITNMPRSVYENRKATLQDSGLRGQCALLVEIMESDDEGEPALDQPGLQDPLLDNTGREPGLQDPVLESPGLRESGRQDPGLDKPGLREPGLQDAGLEKPGLSDPVPRDPGLENPGLREEGFQDPGLENPSLRDPNLQDPGLEKPGLREPGLQDAGLEKPGLRDPGLQDPALENPCSREPELHDPGLGDSHPPDPSPGEPTA